MKALVGSLAIIVIAFCSFFSKPDVLENSGSDFFAELSHHKISPFGCADFLSVYAVQPLNHAGFVQKLRKTRKIFFQTPAIMCFEDASGISSAVSETLADLFYEHFLFKYGCANTFSFVKYSTSTCGGFFAPQVKVLLI